MMLRTARCLTAALAVVIAAACGHDELLAGLDASAGVSSGGVASTAGLPDASSDGSSASGGSSPSGGGSTASGGASNDATIDGLAGSAGTFAEASSDSPTDTLDAATDAGDAVAAVVPDFKLVDQNPNSPLSQQQVSPRDYLGQVSAWYFGSAT